VNILELGKHRDGIEAEIFGVPSHDAARIGERRQIAELFAFERHQVMTTDARRALSFAERNTLVGTRVPQ